MAIVRQALAIYRLEGCPPSPETAVEVFQIRPRQRRLVPWRSRTGNPCTNAWWGGPSLLKIPASIYPAAFSKRLQMDTRSNHPPPRSFERSIEIALRNQSGDASSSSSSSLDAACDAAAEAGSSASEVAVILEGRDVEVEVRIRLLRLRPLLSLAPALLAPSLLASLLRHCCRRLCCWRCRRRCWRCRRRCRIRC